MRTHLMKTIPAFALKCHAPATDAGHDLPNASGGDSTVNFGDTASYVGHVHSAKDSGSASGTDINTQNAGADDSGTSKVIAA